MISHPLPSIARDAEATERELTADRNRPAQDLEESRYSKKQVNLPSRISGSLPRLLSYQQAAPFVCILSKFAEQKTKASLENHKD
jgi:hypothetical protein